MQRATIAALLYLVGGGVVLYGFLIAPPDGLANFPLALYVAPATAAGLLVGSMLGLQFPFTPAALGYYGSHVAFFLPALVVCAQGLRLVVAFCSTRRQ